MCYTCTIAQRIKAVGNWLGVMQHLELGRKVRRDLIFAGEMGFYLIL